jgi:hypothetical protein
VLIKRGCKGKDNKCCFSDELKTLDHLFFGCKLAKFVWGIVKCPTEIVEVNVHF